MLATLECTVETMYASVGHLVTFFRDVTQAQRVSVQEQPCEGFVSAHEPLLVTGDELLKNGPVNCGPYCLQNTVRPIVCIQLCKVQCVKVEQAYQSVHDDHLCSTLLLASSFSSCLIVRPLMFLILSDSFCAVSPTFKDVSI